MIKKPGYPPAPEIGSAKVGTLFQERNKNGRYFS